MGGRPVGVGVALGVLVGLGFLVFVVSVEVVCGGHICFTVLDSCFIQEQGVKTYLKLRLLAAALFVA